MSSRPGTPALIDVTSADLDASKEFYRGLFGWEYDGSLDPSGTYTYAVDGGNPIAGLRAAQPGQPAAWTLYLRSDAADATAQGVKDLGGQVVFQNEAPQQGHVVIAADPTGAFFGAWQPLRDAEFRSGTPGTLAWAELNTRQGSAADEFYRGLFGYEQQQIGDGATYDYSVWGHGAAPFLGRLQLPDAVPAEVPPHWTVYFGVDPASGTDKLVERAVGLGATLVSAPEDIPAGRKAVLTDVAGAVFAVIDGSKATR